MVATVLGLKYRVVRHQLRREWWRALMLIAGGIWALTLIPSVVWMAVELSTQTSDSREQILVGAAALCVLGWTVVPLLVTGLEDTLDPGRFAIFGAPVRALMPGLTIAAFLTIPALFFLVVFAVLAQSWSSDGMGVRLVALAGALLTVAVMVVGARVSVAWGARAVTTRRTRTLSALAVAAGVGAVAPAGWIIVRGGLENAAAYELPVVLEWLGRTPVGAGMVAPGALARGDEAGAAWRLALMLATVVVLYLAWRTNVAYALVHPVARGGGLQRRADAILDAPGTRAWSRGAAKVTRGADPARASAVLARRAVRARALMYWATDPRYLVGAISVLVMPVLFFALVVPVLDLDPRWSLAAPILLASSIGWGRHNDLAYDSTALWMDVVAGRLGRAVMAARMQAVLLWAGPAVAVAALAVVWWSGLWHAIPGLTGACTGVLGATLGIAAVSSVWLPYRVPAPGESPFGAEVGSLGASVLAQVVSGAAMLAVLPLATLPLILSVTLDARWGWLALVAGVGIGVGACVGGVRAAGALYDRRSGRLVAAVS
ncbi:hypothetical protein [Demequina sp.]|uniref:hypothetical protein n=1 Tax=Demequina sp. TaxID=2050685 RepID=UPI003A8A88B5